MWLVNTSTGRLKFFHNPSDVRYAILSHVWREKEQSFQELQALMLVYDSPRDHATDKIRKSCLCAQRDGYEWLWVDACCINKESSAELSEAINSMFAWYAQAGVCYVLLDDVQEGECHRAPGSSFRNSRWWERGWTLQELIAPKDVVFLAESWVPIGTKSDLAEVVEEISGVDRGILVGELSLHEISVARRMCWASNRRTTRVEDRAYSLLGIFNVHLPTIYGEGGHAFVRLQEEIIKTIPDQSIFAWGPILHDYPLSCEGFATVDPDAVGQPGLSVEHRLRLEMQDLLAPSPDVFAHAGNIQPISFSELYPGDSLDISILDSMDNPSYCFTSYGCRTEFPIIYKQLVPYYSSKYTHVPIALLACEDREDHRPLALLLRHKLASDNNYYVGEFCRVRRTNGCDIVLADQQQPRYHRVASLAASLHNANGLTVMSKIYIHSRTLSDGSSPHTTTRPPLEKRKSRPTFRIGMRWFLHRWLIRREVMYTLLLIMVGIVLPSLCYALFLELELDKSGMPSKTIVVTMGLLGFVQIGLHARTCYWRLLPWIDLPPLARIQILPVLNAPCQEYLITALMFLVEQYFIALPFVAALALTDSLLLLFILVPYFVSISPSLGVAVL